MPTPTTTVLRLIVGLCPAGRLKNRALSMLGRGWTVADTATVRPCVLWKVEFLEIAEDAVLGFGNVLRAVRCATLERGAVLGQLNWVSANARIFHAEPYPEYRSFHLGEHASVTSRHWLDCSGGIWIGSHSTVGGVRSTLISHGPTVRENKVVVSPITIGRSCFVGSNTLITKGVVFADRTMVAAGSVVTQDLEESDSLYGHALIKRVASMEGAAYFSRRGVRIDENSARPVRWADTDETRHRS